MGGEQGLLVGLGWKCEVRYQLSRRRAELEGVEGDAFVEALLAHRRAAFDPGTFFFDWIITPGPALLHCLRTRFAGVFDRDELAVVDGTVKHRSLGIAYTHNFTRTDGVVTPATLDAEYEVQRSKVDYLVGRTLELLDGDGPVTWVRMGSGPAELEAVVGLIAERHPRLDFRVLGVRRVHGPGGTLLRRGDRLATYAMPLAPSCKPTELDWSGNDEVWRRFFEALDPWPW